MKRYLFIFALLLGAVCSRGQVASDQAAVLQKIIGLPELQQYFPKNADGSLKQLYISQYPTTFTAGVIDAMAASKVVFQSPEAIRANKVTAYLVFRGFNISNVAANLNVNYFYDFDYATGKFKMLIAGIEMQKSGAVWNVSKLNLGGDK